MSTLLTPGTRIRDYIVDSRLGGGGQAVTWLARDAAGTRVVLKQLVLRRAETWKEIELFEREAAVLRGLDHPAIPPFLDAFEFHQPDGAVDFFLVQRWVDAPSLAALLARATSFDRETWLHIARSALDILAWLHDRVPPVIHRDVKPSNLLFGTDRKLHLIDFGAVKAHLGEAAEGESTIVGTHGYMPAEQLMGRAGPWSDLHALGATLVHLASGRHPSSLPFEGLKMRFAEVVNLPRPLVTWLESMVAPEPTQRPPTAEAARAALEAALRPAALPSPTARDIEAHRGPRPGKGGRVGRLMLWTAGLGVIAAAVAREPSKLEVPESKPATSVNIQPTPPRDSPFVALKAEGLEEAGFRLTPRRAMLRKAEAGLPMSSLDIAMELTATGDRPLERLEVIVVLDGFQQQTQLVWEVLGDLKPPLEPGETRVVTRRWSDVPNRVARVSLRNPRAGTATIALAAPKSRPLVPTLPGYIATERLNRALTFETRRAARMPDGHKWAGQFVADVQVRVLDPEAVAHVAVQPACVAADGSAQSHNIADYGLQLDIAERFADEPAWSKAGDVHVYRALCFEDTVDVRWHIDEVWGGPTW